MIKKTRGIEEEGQRKKSARPESLNRQRRFQEEKEDKKTARPGVLVGNTREASSKKKTPVRAKALEKEKIPMTAADLVPEEYEYDETFDEVFSQAQERTTPREMPSPKEKTANESGDLKGVIGKLSSPGKGQEDAKKQKKGTKISSGSSSSSSSSGSLGASGSVGSGESVGKENGKGSLGSKNSSLESRNSSPGGTKRSLVKKKGQAGMNPLKKGVVSTGRFIKSIHWKQPAFLRMPAVPGISQEDTSRKVYLSIGGVACILAVLVLGLVLKAQPKTGGGSETLLVGAEKGGNTQTATGETKEVNSGKALVERDPVSFTVSCVGDCTLGTDEYFDWDSSLNNYYDMYGADYFLEFVRDIFLADDLTIANMEGALTEEWEREDKTFAFKGEAQYCQILTDSGVDCANTANNHTHDYGEQGYLDTLEAMRSYGLTPFGYDEVCTIDVKGVKVGISGIYILDDPEGSVTLLRQNMQKLKDAGSELIICIFHWGIELDEAPDKDQTTLGRLAIDLGADLVCGHHPHVLQGIEVYKGRNIVYSVGNFCFGGNTYPTEFETAIFQQTFTVTSEGVAMDNVTNVIPCLVSSTHDYNDYRPTPQTGEEAERILELIDYRSSLIEPPVQSTIGG